MFAFVAVMSLLFLWYTKNFERGSDSSSLNEALLSSAVSDVDQTSRLYPGALLLNKTFETSVWKDIQDDYPEGSAVQFDYLFDTDDSRFTNVPKEASSPTYYIGGDKSDQPQTDKVSYMTGRPVKAVRVKVREKGDSFGWTYTATVKVDAASKH